MDRQAAGSVDVWTPGDTFRLVVFLLVALFTGGTFVLACQNDSKRADMRKECHSKGGVWISEDSQCIKVQTIPLKDQ